MGCGVDFRPKDGARASDGSKGSIFFTLNGELIGTAFTGVTGTLYPTVGQLLTPVAEEWKVVSLPACLFGYQVGLDANVAIDMNFGDRPFRFDLAKITGASSN